jgi:hypothetical protein
MRRTIAKKNTLSRSESKFAGVIGSKIWPTCTAKYSRRLIIWFLSKEKFSRGDIVDDSTRQNINKLYAAVRKASSQNLRGMEALARRASPTSTM